MNEKLDIYDLFLKNAIARKEFIVEFKDGRKVIGVPTCGSMANPKKEILFNLQYEDESGDKVVDQFPIDSVSSATLK